MTTNEIKQLIKDWENTETVFDYFNKHTGDFPNLLTVALDESDPTNWRAAWLVDKLNDRHPKLIAAHIDRILEASFSTENQSKLRHFLKLISLHPITKHSAGKLFDRSLTIFTSPGYAIAIRVHALQILYELSKEEPELKRELILTITQELELHPSAGIVSRGQKILNKLRQQT
jgi:hypothetical protein